MLYSGEASAHNAAGLRKCTTFDDDCFQAALHMYVYVAVVPGDLSLLGLDGNMGLPSGHIVSYNATHAMLIEFARAIYAASSEDDWVEVQFGDPEAQNGGGPVDADEVREPMAPSRLRSQGKQTVSGQMAAWDEDDGEDEGEYDEEEEDEE